MNIGDIRDKSWVSHADILQLNFIRNETTVYFRQHHRQGLRSLILEVLEPAALEMEQKGVVVDGVRRYPRAVPQKMFRIFRARFRSLESALADIRRIQVVLAHLTGRHMAASQEMLSSYRLSDRSQMVLCGLQRYVEGQPLDLWGRLPGMAPAEISAFVRRVKRLARENGLIPDLAGIGNLVLTPDGRLVLVDINNISNIHLDDRIRLDDQAYPVCDKSVEALFLLESRISNSNPEPDDPLYTHFLEPGRRRQVENLIRQGSIGVPRHGQNQE